MKDEKELERNNNRPKKLDLKCDYCKCKFNKLACCSCGVPYTYANMVAHIHREHPWERYCRCGAGNNRERLEYKVMRLAASQLCSNCTETFLQTLVTDSNSKNAQLQTLVTDSNSTNAAQLQTLVPHSNCKNAAQLQTLVTDSTSKNAAALLQRICCFCYKIFSSLKQLNRHKKNTHKVIKARAKNNSAPWLRESRRRWLESRLRWQIAERVIPVCLSLPWCYRCKYCSRVFPDVQKLRQHVHRHERKYKTIVR